MNENDHSYGDGRCDDAMIWGILHSQTHPYTPKYLWNAIWPIENQAAHPPISISSNRPFTTLTWNWFSLTNHSTHSNPLFIFVHLCSEVARKVKDLKILKSLLLSRKVWTPLPRWSLIPGTLRSLNKLAKPTWRNHDRHRDWPEICESNDQLHFGEGIVIFRFRSWVPTTNWLKLTSELWKRQCHDGFPMVSG